MDNTFFITHFLNQEPSRHGWREIPFITRSLDLKDSNYYLGFEFDSPIPADVINKGVFESYYIPLVSPQIATYSQSVWLTPTGEIWLADSENPFESNSVLIDKIKVEENTLDLITRTSGVNLTNIDLPSLPKEIQQSFKQLISNIEIDNSRVRYFSSSFYSIANFPFFQLFDNLQKEITDLLKSIFENKNKKESRVSHEHGTFEITERSSLYSAITAFTYPYYLDTKREFVAGVIPFAYQDYFAIIIAKENKLYKKWVTLRNNILNNDSAISSLDTSEIRIAELTITEAETKDWFKELLSEMNMANGLIHFIEGYIFDDVVTEFQNRNFTDNVHINRMNQEGTNINQLKELSFFSTNSDKNRRNIKNDSILKNSIFVLDPVEAFSTSHNNSRIKDIIDYHNYDVINVRHGLKYPIGVGFSLYALPFLLENNNWKIIQDKAITELEKLRSENNIILDRFGWSFPFSLNDKILVNYER